MATGRQAIRARKHNNNAVSSHSQMGNMGRRVDCSQRHDTEHRKGSSAMMPSRRYIYTRAYNVMWVIIIKDLVLFFFVFFVVRFIVCWWLLLLLLLLLPLVRNRMCENGGHTSFALFRMKKRVSVLSAVPLFGFVFALIVCSSLCQHLSRRRHCHQ